MLKCFLPVLFSSLIALKSHSQAEDAYPIDKELQSCIDSNGSTIGKIECLDNAYHKWNNELNKYYKLLTAKINFAQKSSLKESQRQWLIYANKETKFYNDLYVPREGSMWNIAMSQRKMEIVRQRAIELNDYYDIITQK